MAKLIEQRSVFMPPEQWLRLEQLAQETNSRARSGRNALGFSWRTFIQRIASGEIIVQERNPYKVPEAIVEATKQVESQQHIQQHTAQKASVQKMPLKMEQLNMLELGAP